MRGADASTRASGSPRSLDLLGKTGAFSCLGAGVWQQPVPQHRPSFVAQQQTDAPRLCCIADPTLLNAVKRGQIVGTLSPSSRPATTKRRRIGENALIIEFYDFCYQKPSPGEENQWIFQTGLPGKWLSPYLKAKFVQRPATFGGPSSVREITQSRTQKTSLSVARQARVQAGCGKGLGNRLAESRRRECRLIRPPARAAVGELAVDHHRRHDTNVKAFGPARDTRVVHVQHRHVA